MRGLQRVVCVSVGLGCWLSGGSASAQQPAGTEAPTNSAAFPSEESPPSTQPQPPPSEAAPSTQPPPAAATASTAPAAVPATPPPETAGRDEPGNRPEEPRFADADSDRVVLFSTAETHPKGTFFFSDYEIILLQFGYAITDSVQIALSGVPPLVEEQPYFFDLALKANFYRSDVVRLAAIGAGTAILVPDSDPDSLFGFRANGVAQFCFERLCRSSFSFNAGTFLNSESNVVIPITLAGGTVLHATRLIKFLIEPAYALAVGEGVEDQPEGFLLNYGIRLSGTNFGFDLAFIRPIGFGDTPFILGVPWLALTYRTDGDPRE